ncbi:FkbM family methyltransferase [Eisenibacter elegans]|jgi:FkbM family methyltransferase|uniref:FkbM family methyltransferase n=1 Tax=Eisenibacter elegans TaxID=997 RepID=UPI0004787A95|nr:FkbM family methyltransferase [Eisenibacter elegans]
MQQILEKINHKYRLAFDRRYAEIHRLTYLPRYQTTTTFLLNKAQEIRIADGKSFLAGYEEIYQRENYRFKASRPQPIIIDCGANIGLSVIYFKTLYPDAQIWAFEADPDIFQLLAYNTEALALKEVTLQQCAIWHKNEPILFVQEGGFSGQVLTDSQQKDQATTVEAVRLADYLADFEYIDFLKIDIEGAEYEVVKDCVDQLHKVAHLFIEYHSSLMHPQRLGQMLDLLSNCGFRYIVKEAFAPKYPFLDGEIPPFDFQVEIFAKANR